MSCSSNICERNFHEVSVSSAFPTLSSFEAFVVTGSGLKDDDIGVEAGRGDVVVDGISAFDHANGLERIGF
jgi:hypothetical protein